MNFQKRLFTHEQIDKLEKLAASGRFNLMSSVISNMTPEQESEIQNIIDEYVPKTMPDFTSKVEEKWRGINITTPEQEAEMQAEMEAEFNEWSKNQVDETPEEKEKREAKEAAKKLKEEEKAQKQAEKEAKEAEKAQKKAAKDLEKLNNSNPDLEKLNSELDANK